MASTVTLAGSYEESPLQLLLERTLDFFDGHFSTASSVALVKEDESLVDGGSPVFGEYLQNGKTS